MKRFFNYLVMAICILTLLYIVIMVSNAIPDYPVEVY